MSVMATIVAFHAHPDDEVLLTGGTLASGRQWPLIRLIRDPGAGQRGWRE
jgi:hypothetical protein